ncbi:DUF192 domain-containing protein [Parachlamydia acanthamoebae]|uniref:DUF192 domain-containing protein n=1 Tax=Parachlamydia acanthamoebae TaxID=83552 RepID=UPI0024E23CD8|nr:DUF192 domain-containing protein [Parachlamydia acanthamoebae]
MRIFCSFLLSTISIFIPLSALRIPIEIEVALTSEQRAWGLMQRDYLPENRGMIFYFPKSLWMFNTLIDLSAAFLDDQGIILEIVELKSYPEMMDPNRPVKRLSDMKKYPPNDKIYAFFLQKSKSFPPGTLYVIEMNKGWFAKHGVKPGDRIVWNLNSSRAYIELFKKGK